MATLTSNISNVSLAVSGNTQQSTTISWSLPTVPSGATISSCTLTGTATASMTKGSATITVNGTTVSAGSNFTINLGTSNTTSSVTAAVKGNNKNANGTVTFSNLVYTVNYTEPVVTHTVTFVDYDGTVLKTQEVEEGGSATAPSNPARDGYRFTGWDKNFSNVISNLTVTAQYIAVSILKIKDSGSWVNIDKIYKKIDGNWVEQVDENWENLFNSNIYYINNGIANPTAILYSDGTFIFSNTTDAVGTHGDIVNTYTGWDTKKYGSILSVPWKYDIENIKSVHFNDIYVNYTLMWFNGAKNLQNISGRILNSTDIGHMFCNCVSLTAIDLSWLNANNATNMAYMFSGCSYLTSLNFGSFNTSNVINMASMLSDCENLTSLDLSNFNTNSVIDMTNMFYNCRGLTSLDLSNFNTSNVTSMEGMFYDCRGLTSLNLNNFNTSNVTDMGRMFLGCESLTSLDLSSFDTSNVIDISGIFQNCSVLTLLDLSNFNTSNVTDMGHMFFGCESLTSLDLSNFNTSNVTNMAYMFSSCDNLELVDLSSFNMNKVTNTNYMFGACTNPNLTIYVKDETAKTKIESGTNFPTTATVIIGSPS